MVHIHTRTSHTKHRKRENWSQHDEKEQESETDRPNFFRWRLVNWSWVLNRRKCHWSGCINHFISLDFFHRTPSLINHRSDSTFSVCFEYFFFIIYNSVPFAFKSLHFKSKSATQCVDAIEIEFTPFFLVVFLRKQKTLNYERKNCRSNRNREQKGYAETPPNRKRKNVGRECEQTKRLCDCVGRHWP